GHAATWIAPGDADVSADQALADPALQAVVQTLRMRGASFGHEIAAASGLDHDALHAALARLVGAGLITSDGFGGLRALLAGPSSLRHGRPHVAGRWSLVQTAPDRQPTDAAESQARALLRRYGIIFRRLLTR